MNEIFGSTTTTPIKPDLLSGDAEFHIVGKGAPTEETDGKVGCVYIDSLKSDVYICIDSKKDGTLIWTKTADRFGRVMGMTIVNANGYEENHTILDLSEYDSVEINAKKLKIIGLAEPTSPKQAVNKEYVDSLVESIKTSGGGSSSLINITKSGEFVEITDMASAEQEAEIRLESETVTDFSNVDVIVSGKNLFSIDKTEFDTNTITLEELENNTIKIKSTSTVMKEVKLYVNIPINTPLVFSMTGNNVFDVKYYYNTQWAKYGNFSKGNALHLGKSTYPQIMISAFIGAGQEVLFEGIQIEIGEAQTNYEISNVTHYTPDNQGVAENIKLVSPITNIFTNTIGVTVNVEYLAIVTVNDIEKMVEKQLEDFKQEITERFTLKSKVAGCKVAVIGDSITDGMYSFINADGSVTTGGSLSNLNKSPCQQIQSRYGFAEVIDLAESGASYTKDGTTSNSNGGIKNRRFTTYLNETDLPTDLDAIIVFGGVNDFTGGRPLGSLEDAPSTENLCSFHSAVRAVLEYLTSNFMEKDIIFITPLQRNKPYNVELGFNNSNTEGKYLRDYVNVIKTLCADYGVTCIDLYSNSKFYANNVEFLKKYMPDGTHPNADGTDRYLNNGVFPVLDKLWFTTDM